MVSVVGKIRYANKKGYMKVNENFKTEAQAKRFKRFLAPSKKLGEEVKIVRLKKKTKKRSGFYWAL